MSASMPRNPRNPQCAFTLVELMIVVVIIGILASIAIPSFGRYVKKARTPEAVGYISKLWSGAVAYYEADYADSNTTVIAKRFPGEGGSVHELTSEDWSGHICCDQPGGRCAGSHSVYSTSSGSNYPWISLGFNIADPHIYVPWVFTNNVTQYRDVIIRVRGNLDCDATYAQFSFRGTAWNTYNTPASGLADPHAVGGVYVVNEIE